MIDDTDEDAAAGGKAGTRRAEILRAVMDGGTLQIKDLTTRFGVSPMTIHRDLAVLEGQGAVHRLRGAVTAEKSMLFESSYQYRARLQSEQKRRLAKAALRHIEPGNAVLWDDSSTTFHVTEIIDEVAPITVITNALPVMNALHNRNNIDLIALGGKYIRAYMGFFGMACEQAIQRLSADVALMSASTIQGLSIYTQDEQVVRTKRAMIQAARKKVLLVDETKFHFSALNYVVELTAFDVVLVAGNVDPARIEELRAAGVRCELV